MPKYVIKGAPVAQARPRLGRGKTYDPTKKYKESAALQVMCQRPMEVPIGPVSVTIVFYMPRPKYIKKEVFWHTKKPDIDNLIKAVLDAMNGILWKDDSQVCSVRAEKIYASEGKEPRTEIMI